MTSKQINNSYIEHESLRASTDLGPSFVEVVHICKGFSVEESIKAKIGRGENGLQYKNEKTTLWSRKVGEGVEEVGR